MKDSYSARELSQAKGVSARAVQREAARNNWSFIERPNSNGGKPEKLYRFDSLPPDLQARLQTAWLRSRKAQTGADAADKNNIPVNGNGNGALREGKMLGLLAYNQAPEKDRELAHVWQEILAAFDSATSARNKRRVSQAKFVELYNAGQVRALSPDVSTYIKSVSVQNLWRMKKQFDEHGLGGLVRKREKKREVLSLSRDQQDYIIGLITQNPDVRPTRVRDYLIHQFGDAPHFTTIFRYMERWKADNAGLYEYLCNPSQWKNNRLSAMGDMAADVVRFCQRWEADSTPADIICADGKRYAGIGVIDVFSRLPQVLITESSKASGIAAVMRRGFLDWGVPEVLIKDHGQDYDSKHIEAVTSAFDIDCPWIPIETPEAKPFIERFFGTLATALFEALPGFCGHNVAERQAIRSREKARDEFFRQFMTRGATVKIDLSRDELQAVIDQWVRFDYAQRPHKGLNGRCPAEMPALSDSPVQRVSDERALDILLAPAILRTVGKKGIQMETATHRSLDMGLHVGDRVLVRPDIADASRIYVFDLKNRYLFTAVDKRRDGLTPEQIAVAKKRQKNAIKNAVKGLEELRGAIADDPMRERLDALEAAGRPIAPIIRTEEYSTPAIEAAKRAVADQVQLSASITEEELADQIARINGYRMPGVGGLLDDDEAEIAESLKAYRGEDAPAGDGEPRTEGAGVQMGTAPVVQRGVSSSVLRFPAPSPRRPTFAWPVDRYKFLIGEQAVGRPVTADELQIIEDFEARLNASELEFWRIQKSMMDA